VAEIVITASITPQQQ